MVVDVVSIGMFALVGAMLLQQHLGGRRAAPSSASVLPQGSYLDLEGRPVMGSGTSKLFVVEFSDFECPFCRRYATDVFGEIKRELIDKGRVRYAFVNNPLTAIHPLAVMLASAAICANQQGRFWEMHTALFTRDILDDTDIVAAASDVGLKPDAFSSCIRDDERMAKTIERDLRAAQQLGIVGTPSFVFGRVDATGRLLATRAIRGSQPFNVFAREVDALARDASPR